MEEKKGRIAGICMLAISIGLLASICAGFLYKYWTRPLYTETVLFRPADCSGIHYRIPGIVTLGTGGMVAYCEKRNGKADDWGDIDIVCRVSTDGTHWGEETVLAGEGEACTYNNPVMITDGQDVVHCVYCREYGVGSLDGGVYYIRSEDGGVTWSDPTDISEMTLPGYRNVIGPGPGHGLCLENGLLILPVWMVPKEYGQEARSHLPSVVSTLYSKDGGGTWEMGEILEGSESVPNPNESTLLELQDGSVMINARNTGSGKRRAVSISPDGMSSWEGLELDGQLQDPCCFGSLARYDRSTVLFSNVDSPDSRDNIRVKISHDEGRTWKLGKEIMSGKGGYSDINVLKGRMVCLVTEYINSQGLSEISYHTFNMRWLLD